MVLIITVPRTCSFVAETRDTSALAVIVSIVVTKVTVYASDGTTLERAFLLVGSLQVEGARFCFGC